MQNVSKDYRIVPLSKELFDPAIALVEAVFPHKPDQRIAKQSFRDSLTQPNSAQQYWLAVSPDGDTIGVTGLYHDYKDKSVVWLGWFGVHPRHRRHGLGSMLLEFSLSEAITKGFSVLKLYSSFNDNERAAHDLYREYGFIQIASDKKADKVFFLKELRRADIVQPYEIKIKWDGPFKVDEVITKMKRAGKAPLWDGEDYGLYQVYGEHTLCGKNVLLYVGITTERTFSQRFKEHKTWLDKDQKDEDVFIYLGRACDPKKHLTDEDWKADIETAEKIMIYIYSPNYNSRELADPPELSPHHKIRLIHIGQRGRIGPEDNAPDDFFI